MKTILFPLLLVTAFSCVSVSVRAQEASSQTLSASEKDAKFVADMMALNMYEVALLKMAVQKALTAELRSAAETMLPDHQRMDAQLTAYANRRDFAMNPEKMEKYKAKAGKWDAGTAGEGWDRDIIEALTDLHKDGVDLLQDARAAVKDQALKEMISTSIPIMQAHLDILIPLKGRIKDDNSINAATPPVNTTGVADNMPAGTEKDAKFLSDLLLANAYELQMMELILKKGNHRSLKDAAQHMLEDHQKLDTRIRAYAKTGMYGGDPDETNKTVEEVNKWRQKKGGMEWDADVIEALIDAHKDGLDMLEDARTDAKDKELRTLLGDAIPVMKMHLEMLGPLKETIKKPWKSK